MPRTFQEQLQAERTDLANAGQPSGGYLTGYDQAALDQFGRQQAEIARGRAAAQQAGTARFGLATGAAQQQMAQGGRNPLAQRQAIMAGGMTGEQAGANAAMQAQADTARLGGRELQAYQSELGTLQQLQEADQMRKVREAEAQSNEKVRALQEQQARNAAAIQFASAVSDERLKMNTELAGGDEQDRLLGLLARSIMGVG